MCKPHAGSPVRTSRVDNSIRCPVKLSYLYLFRIHHPFIPNDEFVLVYMARKYEQTGDKSG